MVIHYLYRVTLQDEEIPTEERYKAIVRLYQTEGPSDKTKWCTKLGIIPQILNQALQYCNFVEEEPEIAKTVAPHIIIETAKMQIMINLSIFSHFYTIYGKFHIYSYINPFLLKYSKRLIFLWQ